MGTTAAQQAGAAITRPYQLLNMSRTYSLSSDFTNQKKI